MAEPNFADLERALDIIVGERLSDVTFVLDQWQLQFDGPAINIMTRIELRDGKTVARDADFRFREQLCGKIGTPIAGAEVSAAALTLTLEDKSVIAISLRDDDRHGPEAMLVFDASRRLLASV